MENTTIKSSSSHLTLKLCVIALAISIFYIALTYSPGFLWGNGAFWQLQTDDVGTYITGLRFFIRDQWRFPLFYTQTLNYPDGANIIFTDSLPLMALIAKILYKVTGLEWNYFGQWFILSNILYGLSIIALLDSIKVRSIPVSIIALLFGFCVFPYIARTFHIALSSHFVIIFALSLYFRTLDPPSQKRCLIYFFILLLLSLLIHFYLFMMVLLIAGAALFTLYLRKRISIGQGFRYAGFTLLILFLMMLLCGHLSFNEHKRYSTLGGVGKYSMNVLAPILPIHSAFFPSFTFDNPSGSRSFETFNYLGVAVIVLVLGAVLRYPNTMNNALKSYWPLALLCLGLFVFSLSNRIYLGPYLVARIPLVPGVETLYKTFKATSRFFWQSVYLLTFLPMVILWKKTSHPKIILGVLLVLAVAQNIEAWPLRQQIKIRTESSHQFEKAAFCESLIDEHDLILVSNEKIWEKGQYRDAVRALYFLAGRENKSMNFCYTARRLLNPTPLETLIQNHLHADIPVLFIVPNDSKYLSLLASLPYRLEQDGVLYASNQYPFKI